MTEDIKDKVVVITGASSGLGEATARLLSAQGASVVLGARRQDRHPGVGARTDGDRRQGDRRDDRCHRPRSGERLVDDAVEAYGRIDVMINNAGLMPQSLLERLKIDEWDRMIDVNIKGVLYGIAAALPYMKQQKSGHFINVSSVAGHKVGPGFAVYAATKFGVRALSEGLRQEVKPYNIRTTVISPGAVATELLDSVTDPDAAATSSQVLCGGQRSPPTRLRARSPSPSASRTTWISTRSCSGPRARNIERKDATMPHVIVKLQSGRSEQQKTKIAEEVTKAIMATANCAEQAVSVSIEDIEPSDWVEQVYKPDIIGKPDTLYKKPGYNPL